MRAIGAALLAAVVYAGAAAGETTPAGEIRVLSSNGMKAVIEDVRQNIERAIGRPLSVEFSTASSLKSRIESGEAFDVAILTPALIDALARQRRIDSGSRVNLARAGVGVGAREGAPKADVSTLDALKATLLDAKSVTFTADGQSRMTIDSAFARLGIADAMRAKTILKGPGEAPAAVASGEAELVLTLISEIVPVRGLRLLGPFPAEVQGYVAFTAARSSRATDVRAAEALLRYLSGSAVAIALRTHGLEPVDR